MDVKIDVRQFAAASKQFRELSKGSLAYAARNAVNALAFKARGELVAAQRSQLVLRNRWLESGARVDRATVTTLRAVVGNVRDAAAAIESGGTRSTRGKHGVPLPSDAARVGGQHNKVLRRPNYLSAITLNRPTPRNATGGRAQRNAVALRIAAEKGQRFAFLESSRGGGSIVSVMGKRTLRIKTIYSLKHRTVKWRGRPVLETAVKRTLPHVEPVCVNELAKQVERALSKRRP